MYSRDRKSADINIPVHLRIICLRFQDIPEIHTGGLGHGVEYLLHDSRRISGDLADSAAVCTVCTSGSVDIDFVDRRQWLRDLCGHLRHDAY